MRSIFSVIYEADLSIGCFYYILLAFSSLTDVDIEKHKADTTNRNPRSCHIKITEADTKNICEKRHGIHPECGNIINQRADIAKESQKTDQGDHSAQYYTNTFFHTIQDR